MRGGKMDDYLINITNFNQKLLELNIKYSEEIERLNNIIKEVREYIEKHICTDSEYPYYMEMASEDYNELLEILDKVNK